VVKSAVKSAVGFLVFAASCSEGSDPGYGPPATIIAVTTGNIAAVAGTVTPVPARFRVTDARSRAVPNVSVTFQGTANVTVSPATATTDVAGEVTTSLTVGTTAGSNVVRATVAGIATPATVTVTIAPAAAAKLRFVVEPAASRTDAPIAPFVTVAVEDAFENRVTTSHDVVMTFASNPTGAMIAGNSTTTSAGLATYPDLLVTKSGSGFRLIAHSAGLTAATSVPFDVTGIGRSEVDRADDLIGTQVHIVYVIPSDGNDRRLDVSGTLARSVASFHNWFIQQSGGLAFRMDQYKGEPDITFFRLSKTNAQVVALNAGVVLEIQRQLSDAGKVEQNKQYLVYYDGASNYACGGAAWPPTVPGQVAAMYLQGVVSGISCGAQQFVVSATDFPRYWEFAALHDLLHTIGIVATNAPSHVSDYPAHVPERNDLMYSGPLPWILSSATTIDVGANDYFGAAVPANLARINDHSIFVAVAAALLPRQRAPSEAERLELSAAMMRLPVHAPYVIRR
jgi:hypothetical protein